MPRYDLQADDRSGWQEAVWAALIVWIAGGLFFYLVDVPWISTILKYVIVGLLGIEAGGFFIYWIGVRSRRERERREAEYRADRAGERLRQMEESKKRGKFDQWPP
ncbi:MAG: hypothetical protein RIC16_06285 [Rhodospirillales bacterium]